MRKIASIEPNVRYQIVQRIKVELDTFSSPLQSGKGQIPHSPNTSDGQMPELIGAIQSPNIFIYSSCLTQGYMYVLCDTMVMMLSFMNEKKNELLKGLV